MWRERRRCACVQGEGVERRSFEKKVLGAEKPPSSYDRSAVDLYGFNAPMFPRTNGAKGDEMSTGSNRFDRTNRSDDTRVPLQGVVLVSVGNTRADAPLVGAVHRRVARLQDLASLIHAYVPDQK